MSYKVGLLDNDPAYQKALMEYFNLRAKASIQLFVFSELKALERYLMTNRLSLLLVGDEFAAQEVSCPMVVLTKYRERANGEQAIFRYQSAEMLVAYIMQYIGQDMCREVEPFLFVAVYSPLGRCGKTTYAKQLCAQYKNSLYINWEGFSGEPGDRETGSYLLYCMKSKNEACFTFLKEHQVETIPAPMGFQDIRQVEAADLIWFRDSLKQRQDYECVIFDIGGTVLSDFSVFKTFDYVIIPTLSDDISQHKIAEFERMLRQDASDICLEKLQYVADFSSTKGNFYM